ncbi:MAG: KGK domain-containing protein [Leptolyngbya sp. BL-A-14]
MDNQFEPLNNDEVLFINVGRVLMVNPTFKVGEFIDALAQAISDRENDWSDDNEGWFGEGLPCEALRFGTPGWQRGRVRIRLEFLPETSKPKMLDVPRERPSRRPEKPDPKFDNVYDDVDDDY